jgi:hypothetical protein
MKALRIARQQVQPGGLGLPGLEARDGALAHVRGRNLKCRLAWLADGTDTSEASTLRDAA